MTERRATITRGAATAMRGSHAGAGPGEVRIKLQGSGVCASNIRVWEGRDWFEYPQSATGSGAAELHSATGRPWIDHVAD